MRTNYHLLAPTRSFCNSYTLEASSQSAEGEDKVRSTLEKLDKSSDLIISETLQNKHFSFKTDSSIWLDNNEMYRAKDICQRLGTSIDKKRPLGYEGEGLLVVFSRNCPNNSLPILHSHGRAEQPWKPLFERIKH